MRDFDFSTCLCLLYKVPKKFLPFRTAQRLRRVGIHVDNAARDTCSAQNLFLIQIGVRGRFHDCSPLKSNGVGRSAQFLSPTNLC
jgi:hypothetical protein